MDEETNFIMKSVTCNTSGCENYGLSIDLPCTDVVVCGICGVAITDVEET